MSNAMDHVSAYPIPPGEFLEEELEVRGVEIDDFAAQVGLSLPDLKELLRGKCALTPAIASRLEAALGIKAYLWLGLEEDYRAALAKRAALLEQRKARTG